MKPLTAEEKLLISALNKRVQRGEGGRRGETAQPRVIPPRCSRPGCGNLIPQDALFGNTPIDKPLFCSMRCFEIVRAFNTTGKNASRADRRVLPLMPPDGWEMPEERRGRKPRQGV